MAALGCCTVYNGCIETLHCFCQGATCRCVDLCDAPTSCDTHIPCDVPSSLPFRQRAEDDLIDSKPSCQRQHFWERKTGTVVGQNGQSFGRGCAQTYHTVRIVGQRRNDRKGTVFAWDQTSEVARILFGCWSRTSLQDLLPNWFPFIWQYNTNRPQALVLVHTTHAGNLKLIYGH